MAERERQVQAEKMTVLQDRQNLEMRLADVIGDRTGIAAGRGRMAPSAGPVRGGMGQPANPSGHGGIQRSASAGRSGAASAAPMPGGGGGTLRDIGNVSGSGSAPFKSGKAAASVSSAGSSSLLAGLNLKQYHADLDMISEEQQQVRTIQMRFIL